MTFEVMSPRSHGDQRANNLRASKKLLNDGFCVARHREARSRKRRRLAETIADDYATGAVGHEVQIPSPQPEKSTHLSTKTMCAFFNEIRRWRKKSHLRGMKSLRDEICLAAGDKGGFNFI